MGGENDYRALVAALHGRGMGQILDTVPNHMSAVPGEDAWWTDVLENGPASPHAPYFDIDWRPVKLELRELRPAADPRRTVRQSPGSGRVETGISQGRFFLRYWQSVLPIDPRTYRSILGRRLDDLNAVLPPDSEDLRELTSILTALEHLPDTHGNRCRPHRRAAPREGGHQGPPACPL